MLSYFEVNFVWWNNAWSPTPLKTHSMPQMFFHVLFQNPGTQTQICFDVYFFSRDRVKKGSVNGWRWMNQNGAEGISIGIYHPTWTFGL